MLLTHCEIDDVSLRGHWASIRENPLIFGNAREGLVLNYSIFLDCNRNLPVAMTVHLPACAVLRAICSLESGSWGKATPGNIPTIFCPCLYLPLWNSDSEKLHEFKDEEGVKVLPNEG